MDGVHQRGAEQMCQLVVYVRVIGGRRNWTPSETCKPDGLENNSWQIVEAVKPIIIYASSALITRTIDQAVREN
jgi:hypothetical protein